MNCIGFSLTSIFLAFIVPPEMLYCPSATRRFVVLMIPPAWFRFEVGKMNDVGDGSDL